MKQQAYTFSSAQQAGVALPFHSGRDHALVAGHYQAGASKTITRLANSSNA
jgi:hypothetical protein